MNGHKGYIHFADDKNDGDGGDQECYIAVESVIALYRTKGPSGKMVTAIDVGHRQFLTTDSIKNVSDLLCKHLGLTKTERKHDAANAASVCGDKHDSSVRTSV